MTTPPPIRRRIVVSADPDEAFRIFTEEIGVWWPLDDQRSVLGPGGSVAFVGDRLVETSPQGKAEVWAEVLEWHPGRHLRLAWHPGGLTAHATEVRLSFSAVDQADGQPVTLVTLEHDGWERSADPEGTRREYDGGWSAVLSAYGLRTLSPPVAASAEPQDLEWVVLRHSLAVPVTGSVFEHPDFGCHAEFLGQMAAEGVLVAAGWLRLGDQQGAQGMTVLAVPPALADEYRRRAAEEDQAVRRGLFAVQTIDWRVVMTGVAALR